MSKYTWKFSDDRKQLLVFDDTERLFLSVGLNEAVYVLLEHFFGAARREVKESI